MDYKHISSADQTLLGELTEQLLRQTREARDLVHEALDELTATLGELQERRGGRTNMKDPGESEPSTW